MNDKQKKPALLFVEDEKGGHGMGSIFIQECEPRECSACAMWLRGPFICSITKRFDAEECPLQPIGDAETISKIFVEHEIKITRREE